MWERGVVRSASVSFWFIASGYGGRIARDQNRRKNRRLHSSVVAGVDANLVLFEPEGVLAELEGFQLVVALEVRPPPHAAVYDVWKSLAMGNL